MILILEGKQCAAPRQLALEAIEPMADAHLVGVEISEQVEGMLAGDIEVLRSMLVMNRERFLRLAPERRGAPRQCRQLAPGVRRFVDAAGTASNPRQPSQGLAMDFRFRTNAPGSIPASVNI